MRYTQHHLEKCVDENDDFIICPECGKDDFSSSRGVAMHYSYNHDGNISYLFRCENCENLSFGNGQKNRFCSKDCETLHRTGTLKYTDEDYLRKEIEEKENTVTEVADELDVDMKTVSKWVLKYGIGNEYECPSCERKFATKQSVSKHHHDEHGESIAGSYYTCEYCGEENWTPKSSDHSKYPKYCDDDCFGKSMEGEDNPNKSEERREKISNGLIDAYAEGRKTPGHMVQVDVEETENTVDSSWEAEIDRLLHSSDIEYFYNGGGEYKRYDFNGFTHAPDFIIPQNGKDIVIEVKGSGVMFFQEDKMKEIGRVMKNRTDVLYVVYGDVDLECNYQVNYGNEEELLRTIKRI